MAFKPGNTAGKGRPKGSPNKNREAVREIVEKALGKSIPERLVELSRANPRMEAAILTDLLPYAYPKLQAIEHSGEIDSPGQVTAVTDLVEWLKNTREIK